MSHNHITEGSIAKPLLSFFFPIWLGTFFQFFYNTADAVIVGNFVGKEALAAVGGPTGTIINLLVGFFVGLSSGATVIISQLYGAHKTDETQRAVHTAAALSLTAGAVLTFVGIVFSPMILRAMGTPPEILGYSVTYIRIYFVGTVFNLIYNIGAGILQAVGDSRRPLYFLIACSATNVVLDILLVVVIPLGVAGAAIATVVSQIVSALLIVISLQKAPPTYRLIIEHIRFDFVLLMKMVRIGLPAGVQSVMYSVSNIIIQASVNSFGTNAVAAWTAYGKIDGVFWMTISSFGIAITTFVGQNFGAQKYDRVKKSVWVCMLIALGFTVVISTGTLLFDSQLYHLFTQDAAVIEIGIRVVNVMVPFYFTYISIEILSGALRGTGDGFIPMIITCLGVCVLRIVWIAIAVPLFPCIETASLSYPVTWSVTSICFIIYYLQGGWLKRSIAKAGHKNESV
ncbi:MAG: MATE family efflux transporter [Ruthenibacterium sp.]